VPVLEDFDSRRHSLLETEILQHLKLCSDLLAESHAQCVRDYPTFEVPFEEFREAIAAAAKKYLTQFPEQDVKPSVSDLKRFIRELKLSDLYLGLGCLRGDEHAWWEFDQRHRLFLERWTRHLVGSDTDADEVIDAVYVELFGTKIVDGVRQSKFRTFTGRGTLRGWLRAIILNAAVDLHRAPKIEISVEALSEYNDEPAAQNLSSAKTEEILLTRVMRERYRAATMAALDRALTSLDDHETLLLLYYHVEGLKLREIARIIDEARSPIRRWFHRHGPRRGRVHESTVMRRLNKIYKKILEHFQAELAGRHGLKPEEIEICKTMAAEDPESSITISRLNDADRKDEVRIRGVS
jgi:RNA polymerase sigma-70 factor, ECF subfamily